mgnify:CR=1 FL=1
MKSVLYLFYKETKNTILRALKNPAAIIGYIAFFAFYLWLGIRMGNNKEIDATFFSKEIFYVMLAAISVIQTFAFTYPSSKTGINGYRVSDVNLLFQAPVRTFDILISLLLRQFSSSFFSTVILLAQIPMIKAAFGLSSEGVILYVFASFASTVFGTILMVLKVFILRNRPKLTAVFKISLIASLGILLFYPIIPAVSHTNPVNVYLEAFKSHYLDMVPFFGWLRAIGVSPLTGLTPSLIISFFILVFICLVGLFYLYRKTDTEWFEESVKTAEQSGITAEAIKKGSMPTFSSVKRKKPIHFIFTGQGSVAILQKHLLEYRKTGFLFVNFKSILYLIIGGGMGYLLAKGADNEIPVLVLSLLLISFLSVLFSMVSRWTREARSPYLYLIPDTPIRKLFMITASSAFKHIIDGLFFFVPICIFTGASFFEILLAVIAYTLLNQNYINVEILGNRIFGKLNASNFKFIINYFVRILLFIPAIGVSIAIDVAKLPTTFSILGYLVVTAVFYITFSIYAAVALRNPECFE